MCDVYTPLVMHESVEKVQIAAIGCNAEFFHGKIGHNIISFGEARDVHSQIQLPSIVCEKYQFLVSGINEKPYVVLQKKKTSLQQNLYKILKVGQLTNVIVQFK